MPEQENKKERPKVRVPAAAPAGEAAYAELEVTSNFSFLHGGSHPEELMARA